MGFPGPKDWSIALGLAVQIVYLVGFVALAKTKAIWGEEMMMFFDCIIKSLNNSLQLCLRITKNNPYTKL